MSGPRAWLEELHRTWQRGSLGSWSSASAPRLGVAQRRVSLRYPVPRGYHPEDASRDYTDVQVSLAMGHARSTGPQLKDIEKDFIEAGRGSLLRGGAGLPGVAKPFTSPFPFFVYTSADERDSKALQGCHPGTGHLSMSYPFYGVLLHLGSLLNSYLSGLLNTESS